MFGQPPHDRQLCPQHVAFGHVGNDLLGRRLDLFERLCEIDTRHRQRQRRRLLTFLFDHLLRAQHGRLHGVDLDRHIGDCAHDFLLILNRLHIFLCGRAGDEQAELLRLRHQLALFPERALDFFGGRRPA